MIHLHFWIYIQEKNYNLKMNPKFIAALFTIGKIWKQPKGPLTDEWIGKL